MAFFKSTHYRIPNSENIRSTYLPVDPSCTDFQLHCHGDHSFLNLLLKPPLSGHSGVPGGDKVSDDFLHRVVDLLIQVTLIIY